jgi:hypothetical protein
VALRLLGLAADPLGPSLRPQPPLTSVSTTSTRAKSARRGAASMLFPPEARVEHVLHILQRCGQQPGAQVAIANKKVGAIN